MNALLFGTWRRPPGSTFEIMNRFESTLQELDNYTRDVNIQEIWIVMLGPVPLISAMPISKAGVPDGAARLKTRSTGWNRAGWEMNTLDG